jgi:hypothetical protein
MATSPPITPELAVRQSSSVLLSVARRVMPSRYSFTLHVGIRWLPLGMGRAMFRVVACVALLLSGCAIDPLPAVRTITKVVTVKEPGRTCRIETRPMTSAEFCTTEKKCGQIGTCAEAYYRLTVCGHRWLDGGAAVRKDGEPNRKGEPDGIPCEQELCGRGGARGMVAKIRAEQAAGKQPFSLPMAPAKEKCDPA